MIIVHLTGGLGNQLFQYAFARSLAHEMGCELFLDISLFSHTEMRKHVVFGLHSFNIKGIVGYYPYVDETRVGISQTKPAALKKYVEGVPFPDSIWDYGAVDNFENIELPAYFQGWYQNQIDEGKNSYITENFFKINRELIHDDLTYSLPLSESFQKLSEDIRQYDSVALHIRHGDYREYPKFGLCTEEYYQSAIRLLEEKLDNPKFYIFTEDPEWAGNLRFDSPHEVIRFSERNDAAGRGYGELLKVMSLCSHFIIANSTYSWWASFLSENENKMIISPKPWFQDRSILQTDTIDNVATINLKNDYSKIYDESDKVLYDSNNDRAFNPDDSDFIIKDISSKNPDCEAIIKFSLKSNCFNGLRVYYKTRRDPEFSQKNSLDMYYYRDESLEHCLILPKECILDEIKISPYILDKNDSDRAVISSVKINQIGNGCEKHDNFFKRTSNLKRNILKKIRK